MLSRAKVRADFWICKIFTLLKVSLYEFHEFMFYLFSQSPTKLVLINLVLALILAIALVDNVTPVSRHAPLN